MACVSSFMKVMLHYIAQLLSCVNKERMQDLNLKGSSAVLFNFQIKCLQKAIVQILDLKENF